MVNLGYELTEIKDQKNRFESFNVRSDISGFGMKYHELMAEPTNVDLAQEMATIAMSAIAREFCEEKYPKSDVVPKLGIMYGKNGVVLIYQPVFDIRTGETEGMKYDNKAGLWLPNSETFDKDSKTLGLYIAKDGNGRNLRVYTE